jgi:LPS-assembly protein
LCRVQLAYVNLRGRRNGFQHPAKAVGARLALLLVMGATAPAHAQIISRFATKQPPQQPAKVTGREFVYDYKTDTIIVRGNAELVQGLTAVKADELDYSRRTKRARAFGHVHLIDPEVELRALKAEISSEDETGRLVDADLHVRNGTYHLAGKEIAKLQGQRYSVRGGFFTTCGCETGAPSWSISADSMDVHIGGEGSARNVRFSVLGYPILRLPYFVFPANADRASGFLAPRMGQSRLRGFQYVQPYYIAINPSSDATIALDAETAARIGFLTEYRLRNGEDDYLRFTGAFFDESIRENRLNDLIDTQIADPHVPTDRWGFIGLTREHLAPGLVFFGDSVAVSDSLYLREMNLYTLSRGYGSGFGVLRDTISHFGFLQSFQNDFIRLQGIWTDDLIQPQGFALQTLPELRASGRRSILGGFAYSDYDLQAVNFRRADGVQGWRFDLNPRLTVPWRLGDYLMGFGSVGARETAYDASGHNIDVIPVGTAGLLNNSALRVGPLNEGGVRTRELVDASAGASTILERVYDLNWGSIEKIKHTIEPLVTYNWVPIVDQSRLPLWDETDRVNARNLLTYGVVSRIFVKTSQRSANAESEQGAQETEDESEEVQGTGESQVQGGTVREAARISLLNAYDFSHLLTPGGAQLSDVELNGILFPSSIASFSGSMGYSPHQQQITYVNAFLTFRPPWTVPTGRQLYMGRALTGPFLQIGYNFVGARDATHNFSARVYYELLDRIGLYYAPLYDFAAAKLLSAEYGIRLKSKCNCWAFDVGITDTVNPQEVQVQFQVTLGGLGSVGHNPFGRNPFRDNYGGTGVLPSRF